MDRLITDVVRLILERLSPEARYVARFVCKRWNSLLPKQKNSTITAANFTFDLKLVQWAYSLQLPLGNYASEIGRHGNIEVYSWSLEKGFWMSHYYFIRHAVIHGQLEFLQWIHCHDKGVEYIEQNDYVYEEAIKHDHLEIMKWMLSLKVTLSDEDTLIAAKYGRLKILQWMVEIGCILSSDVLERAVSFNQFEVAEWLLSLGHELRSIWYQRKIYFFGPETIKALNWLRQHKCPFNKAECIEAYRSYYHDDIQTSNDPIAQWILTQEFII